MSLGNVNRLIILHLLQCVIFLTCLYYSTVNLAKVEGEWPCKFWVNSTVEIKPVMINGAVALIPTPAQYW